MPAPRRSGLSKPSRIPRTAPGLFGQGLDTSTPCGRAMFGMLGVFAEFEREMIAELRQFRVYVEP